MQPWGLRASWRCKCLGSVTAVAVVAFFWLAFKSCGLTVSECQRVGPLQVPEKA